MEGGLSGAVLGSGVMDSVFGTVMRRLPASAGFFTQGYGDLASVHALNREVRHCLRRRLEWRRAHTGPRGYCFYMTSITSLPPAHRYAFDGLGFRRSILAALPN